MSHQHRNPSIDVDISRDSPMDIVNKVLNLINDRRARENLFKSPTSYRRIHDLLAGILDTLERTQKPDKAWLQTQLAKAKVIIRYQAARGQIGNELADILMKTIDHISKDQNQNKMNFDKVRLLIDSLAVVAKEME